MTPQEKRRLTDAINKQMESYGKEVNPKQLAKENVGTSNFNKLAEKEVALKQNKLSRKLNTTPPNAKGTVETAGIKQPKGFYLGEGAITNGKQLVPYTPPNSMWDKLKGYGSKILSYNPIISKTLQGLGSSTALGTSIANEYAPAIYDAGIQQARNSEVIPKDSLNIDPYLTDLDTQKARFGEAYKDITSNPLTASMYKFNPTIGGNLLGSSVGTSIADTVKSILGYGTDFNDSFKDGVPKDFYANKEQVNPKQQVIANQPAQSNISQEQALQIQQNNALLDYLNNESKINTLLASGAMRGSIDQANMNKWTDIQNYNAQGQAMADVRKAMNSKSAGFTPVEYQPIQIPQEFIQAQQLQNQLKTNPIHNINSYGMNIPNNVNNVSNTSTINTKLPGTVNGKTFTNGSNIKGMFDDLYTPEQRAKIKANARQILLPTWTKTQEANTQTQTEPLSVQVRLEPNSRASSQREQAEADSRAFALRQLKSDKRWLTQS